MALIGSFPASGSSVFNLDFLPEKVLINDITTTNPLSNFSVVTSGVQLMSITDSARLYALSQFDSGGSLSNPSGGQVESLTVPYLRLATGRVNKATTIQGTNPVASVRDFFAASTNISDVARRAVEQSINPSANATFDNFEGLFFLPTHILRAQITFANGFTDEYSVNELAALYGNYHISDEFGFLGGLVAIDADSGAGLISQVVLFNGSGGTTVVLKSDYVQL